MFQIVIRSNAAEARRLSAIVSPHRNFVPTGQRGVYALPADSEVLALRDTEFLTTNGATVLAIEEVQA